MLKRSHPDWGCQRISDALVRGPALSASPSAVARVLHEAGYETVLEPTRPHRAKERRFERARANQLWQTDLLTFMLKRQNRRLYMVAFLDDHSRFIVSFGLHASASTSLVIEALEAGIASYGPPEELLTDNGPQYVTWRGKSRFTKHLEKRGIKQLIARPKRPQTLGKIERFWGTVWRELVETAVFLAWRRQIKWTVLRQNLRFFLAVGFLVATATALSFAAVAYIDPGSAALVSQTYTLITLGLGIFWLRERLRPLQLVGAVIAIIGLFVISFQPGETSNLLRLGALLVLLSNFTYALHTAVVKRYGDALDFGNFFLFRVGSTALLCSKTSASG
jgi:transposase InsO family protein